MSTLRDVMKLDDERLVRETVRLHGVERGVLAELLVYLGEVDARRLYAQGPYSSMYAWCHGELGLSESQTAKRIRVARAARRFPALLEAIEAGRLHLSAAHALAPVLTEEKHRHLIAQSEGKSRMVQATDFVRDAEAKLRFTRVQMLVAAAAPKPPVPDSVRRLPRPGPKPTPPSPGTEAAPKPAPTPEPLALAPQTLTERAAKPKPGRVSPLSGETFKVTFTADAELVAKLDEVRDLLSHAEPGADLATVVGRALDVLKERLLVRKRGAGKKAPEKEAEKKADDIAPKASRHIPAEVRHAVWERDEGCCAFHDQQGRRCGSKRLLEFHHLTPWAKGGEHTVAGIQLRCRAHNLIAAFEDFGQEQVERIIRSNQTRRPSG